MRQTLVASLVCMGGWSDMTVSAGAGNRELRRPPAVFQLTKLLGFRPRQAVDNSCSRPAVRLLAITANDCFYADLVDIASSCGWEIRRAGAVKEALDAIRALSIPLVVLDAEQDGHDWRGSLPRLISASTHPCVLVASRFADENMRQEVLRFHGYD